MILRPHLLQEAEFKRKAFLIVLEPGTSLDDVLKPTFWVHVGNRLKPFQKIEVHAADGTWYAELLVRSASRTSASVAVIHRVDLESADLSDDIGDHEVRFRGRAGWSAINKTTKGIVVEGLASKQAVVDWLRNPRPAAQAA